MGDLPAFEERMKTKYLFLAILVTGFLLIFRSEVGAADVLPCAALLLPLENKIGIIKDQGGIWGMFDKSYKVRNHATVTLKLDSKINVLIFRLQHLCATQTGVPFDEIAQVLVPQLKAKGEQGVMEHLINIGHVVEEAEKLIAYARFAESNLNRKLKLDRINKTIKESQSFVNRLAELFKKIGEVESEKLMADLKVLIRDVEKFLETDPYLVLAHKETAEVPHARYITGDSDAM